MSNRNFSKADGTMKTHLVMEANYSIYNDDEPMEDSSLDICFNEAFNRAFLGSSSSRN